MRSQQIRVEVDLARVRENAVSISKRVGVDVIAVVKARAYGLGARRVAETIGDLVSGFCVFSLEEARTAALWEVARKPILALGPAGDVAPEDLIQVHVRPAVWTVGEANRLRAARPVLCVDTGMQRFACPLADVDAVLRAGEIDEAFTHAIRLEHARMLAGALGGRGLRLHAATSALLDEPEARLNAVRPGMALYRGAVRVATRLVEARDGASPAGYGGFVAERFGVILCGYSHGLRRGPCLVGGARRSILEVGMQSAFVEIGPGDRVGSEVVLLGDSLTESDVATAWSASEQQALLVMASMGAGADE
ncbi:MAG TPA: alanine racemase [Tepidisphaeraceae bacterium]|jgi:alanine racemase|nr:alanine racemase [Tepidisphaeraceae bacterium]